MPIRDPQKKREATRAWRERVMPQGYGKWLYARRKLRFEDAEMFRDVLRDIAEVSGGKFSSQSAALGEINMKALSALEESRRREEELGPWIPPS